MTLGPSFKTATAEPDDQKLARLQDLIDAGKTLQEYGPDRIKQAMLDRKETVFSLYADNLDEHEQRAVCQAGLHSPNPDQYCSAASLVFRILADRAQQEIMTIQERRFAGESARNRQVLRAINQAERRFLESSPQNADVLKIMH